MKSNPRAVEAGHAKHLSARGHLAFIFLRAQDCVLASPGQFPGQPSPSCAEHETAAAGGDVGHAENERDRLLVVRSERVGIVGAGRPGQNGSWKHEADHES